MRIRPLLLAAATYAAAACGGAGEIAPPPPFPSYTLALASGTLSVQQGQSGTVSATLTRTDFPTLVNLSVTGLPSGAAASVAPNPAPDAAVITISAGTAVPGTYNLSVTGSAAGVTDRTASLSLTVTAAPVASSYTMSLSPGAASVQQGSTTPVAVTITRTNFTGNVTLTLDVLPPGATVTFGTNPVNGTSSSLTLGGGSAAPGTYNLTVVGKATGFADRTAPFALTITPGPVATTSVTLQNFAFNPPDIRVGLGATVTWTNQDNTPHNVSFSSAAIGSTTNFSSGSQSLVMPTAAGTYNYRCTIHNGMSGTVLVQ